MLKNISSNSKLALANSLLRNREYEGAVAVYRAVLLEADGPMSEIIQFNIDWAMMRLDELSGHPQSLMKLQLLPAHQIESEGLEQSQWRSIGKDPYFILQLKYNKQIYAGWYEIEVALENSQKRKVSQLYPDYGVGFSEETSIIIHHDQDSAVATKQVIRFAQDVVHLRFDPMSHPGEFGIPSFNVRLLTEMQAADEMRTVLKKNVEPRFSAINETLSMDELYHEYRSKISVKTKATSYHQWIDNVETPSLPSESEVKHSLNTLGLTPLISILVPTYNTEERYLRACIESVIRQSYPFWELCIADDASNLAHVRIVLDEYEKKNSRIKVTFREKNGHISRASNSALALARGQYVALLDHDDELAQHALYYVALAINCPSSNGLRQMG
jgi:hypothetical protein